MLVHARPDCPDNRNVQSKLGLYLASGRPIAATDVGDYGPLLAPSRGCRLARPDPVRLAVAIAAAGTDPDVAAAARSENPAIARRHFESSENAARLLRIYDGLHRSRRRCRAVGPPPERAMSPAAIVLGVPVWGLSREAFVNLAVARIAARQKTLFTTANAHSIVVAQHVPAFRAHFREASAVLPDGTLAVWGARHRRGPVAERVAGPDFVEAFLARAERERRVGLLPGGVGGDPAAHPRAVRGALAAPRRGGNAGTPVRRVERGRPTGPSWTR